MYFCSDECIYQYFKEGGMRKCKDEKTKKRLQKKKMKIK